MPMSAARRTVLLGMAASALTLTGTRSARADATHVAADPDQEEHTAEALAGPAYAGIRVVRATPGTPQRPEIIVPAGYSLVTGAQYQVASRAEFTSFIQGPANTAGIRVFVRWPGQQIRAVVAGERRLRMIYEKGDASTVAVTLPISRTSPTADSATIQVWSTLSSAPSGINWLVAHNDPDRAVGYWATTAWPAGEVRAVVSYMAACDAILRDSGLAATARQRRHFFMLQGFETNNMLHLDNPPHWHMSYYPGATTGATPATVPHFWVDARGRTFYNGQDVTGRGRTKYYANDLAPIYDGAGTLILTTMIRADGGLDVIPPNGPTYSITSASGDYTGQIEVLRDAARWRTVTTDDRVRDGIMRIDISGVDGDPVRERVEYEYDPLTGPVLRQRPF